MPRWAMPRAHRKADFTCSGQLGGSGTEDESGSVQTLIPQAEPGRKGPPGPQKFLMNDSTAGFECGRICAGLGPQACLRNRWTRTPVSDAIEQWQSTPTRLANERHQSTHLLERRTASLGVTTTSS